MTRCLGLGLLSASTLLLELSLTRVLSVAQWYHFAFLVLSTAMLGFGGGAVALALRPSLARREPEVTAALAAAAMSATVVLGFAALNGLPLDPFRVFQDGVQVVYLLATVTAAGLPFFCSGLATGILLLAARERVGRLYAWDLVGAGAGCLALIPLMPALGGAGCIAASAAGSLIAAAFLAWPGARELALAALGLSLAAGPILPNLGEWVRVRTAPGKVSVATLADPEKNLFSAWNSFSRVDVIRYPDQPGRESELRIWIDAGTAGTGMFQVTRRPEQLRPRGVSEDPVLALCRSPRVLVLGSGGGGEVLSSLIHGAREVKAVEINPIINGIVRARFASYLGDLFRDPRVALITDDARGFMSRDRTVYDAILSVHTMSNAATAAGALSLTENTLLTAEGFTALAGHLAEGGTLLVTRPEAQLPRLFSTALGELRRRAATDPAGCLVAFRLPPQTAGGGADGRSFVAGICYRNRPFPAAERARVVEAYQALGAEILFAGTGGDESGTGGRGSATGREGIGATSIYERLARSSRPELAYDSYPEQLRPATDDCPFFNQRLRWDARGIRALTGALTDRGAGARLATESLPLAEAAVAVVCFQSVAAAGIVLLLPLWFVRGQQIAPARLGRCLGYFGAVGIGFMMVEVTLTQQLTLLLGHPSYTLMVVLAGLLVASGVGSAWQGSAGSSAPAPAAVRNWEGGTTDVRPGRSALFVALALMVEAALAPRLVATALAWPFLLRVGACLAIVIPIGFLMGRPFPQALAQLAERQGAEGGLAAWAWAANTFGAVAGSSMAVLVSLTQGFTAAIVLAAAFYAAAAMLSRAGRGGGSLLQLAAPAACLLLFAGAGCRRPGQPAMAAPVPRAAPVVFRFEDLAAHAGLRFHWGHGGKSPLTNLESFGCGCAFWDYDDDGWLDILLVGEPKCAAYHNEPDGKGGRRFVDVTSRLGLDRITGPWKGCAIGDYDNDGWPDVFLSGYHTGALLRNDRGRRLVDVTRAAHIRHRGWGSSAGFADYDGDGHLDLFVGNYLKFGPESLQHCRFRGGAMGGCPPQVYPAERGVLYHNRGDGTFEDATRAAGMADSGGKTMAIGWCDFDDDGRADLYLANDGVPGDLYRNEGGHFTNVGILSGTAFGAKHLAQAGMGVDWADYDRDGRMDLVVTAFSDEPYSLYHNQGLFFDNVSEELGIGRVTFKPLGFGCRFVDVDNDGWPDLVFANGHVYDQSAKIDPETPYREPLILMRNEQGRMFADVSGEAGPAFHRPIVGRGLASGDFDNDGRVDLLVVDYEGTPLLLHNCTETRNHALRLRLLASAGSGNRFAYGARVWVESRRGRQVCDLTPVASYLSSSDARVHVGLGELTAVERVVVRWPGGARETFPAPPVDREVTLVEGGGSGRR
jgi:hypothetical protein